ncbi:hypothetical protein GIB67_041754 [Kingdonia uniflora]|uniref:Hydroxyproline-rich glycoprotein family protein n=1 Tax=Kingdonia uniflora TaxID=39325 RepID=A0A7J7NW30_9MAGN|nr:hypothetical protein GIB67_041754 [Kingdonia uniflora]
MEENSETPRFWIQNNKRRSSSSTFLNSGVLITVLLITALILIFFVVPTLISFTNQIVKPTSLKKSWTSFNLVLVLFAILCGLLGKKSINDDINNGVSNSAVHVAIQQPNQWVRSSDVDRVRATVSGLRSSSSYPDLREEPLLKSFGDNDDDDGRWRFFDDSDVYRYRPFRSSVSNEVGISRMTKDQPQPGSIPETDDSGVKTIGVDTFVIRNKEAPPASPPHAAEESPELPKPRRRRSQSLDDFTKIQPNAPRKSSSPPAQPLQEENKYNVAEEIERKPMRRSHSLDNLEELSRTQSPLSPSRERGRGEREQKSGKSGKKRGGAKELASTIASLYNQTKKKKRRQRSKESFDDASSSPPLTMTPRKNPPPPAPPPPPPTSVFHQLFKKGSKSKRFNSVSSSSSPSPPPAPPPPPPSSNRKSRTRVSPPESPSPPPLNRKSRSRVSPPESASPPLIPPPSSSSSSSRKRLQSVIPPPESPSPPSIPSDSNRRRRPSTPGRPPLPTKFTGDDHLNSGNQSPLIPMPPPPPPPPFKISAFSFKVRDGFVNIRSTNTSRCSSPELDTVEISSIEESLSKIDGDAGVSVFCPSPDVDTKADTFIARFRAGLRLEKVNSWKAKQDMGFSGPSPGPGPSYMT